MKAKYVYESLDFERGRDPKSTIGIGLAIVVYNRWEELQQTQGIGSINIEKSLNGRWHLVIYVSQIGNSKKYGFDRTKAIFGDLIGNFYNTKGGEILIAIPNEYERGFIDAYNLRYPEWPMEE